jgi:hypothetical protein
VNIYIAGKFESQARLRTERDRIHAETAHKVAASWLDEPAAPVLTEDQCRAIAFKDYEEVKRAHLLILDTFDENLRGGREVEWGIALGRGFIARWLVGPVRNIFHHMHQRHFTTWAEVHEALGDLR